MEPISLSILGALGSIVSIFNGGFDLVKKFRKHRKERKKAKENKALQKSVHKSRARSRQAHDDMVRLLSQSFRYEDEISRSQFRLISNKVRVWIDLALVSSRDEISIIFPKAALLRSMSDEIQSSIGNDLAGLAQRMVQAAPIQQMRYHCPQRNEDHYSGTDNAPRVIGFIKCYGCGWESDPIDLDLNIDAAYSLSRHALRNSDASGEDGKFICRVCFAVKDYHGLADCLQWHGVHQVRRAYGSESAGAWTQ
ncbi:hypothetical protein PG985_008109 [Apiospora marii]|uniref:Uncharacterized protein n=1 Tax=Apiospora marii TaxID=335849 RepID=A0ABR1R9G9_9PEZI